MSRSGRTIACLLGLSGLLPLAHAQNVLYTFHGEASGDAFGSSVAAAGDVDADGFPDLIVGQPGSDVGMFGAGGLQVLSGRTGDLLAAHYGFVDNGFLGRSVDGVGDVNADGHADYISGANYATVPPQSRAGYVRVYSGVDGSVLYEITGSPLGGEFGFSSAGAGDVDNDGFPDFIVGAPKALINRGHAVVFSGFDGSVLHDLVNPVPDGQFGWDVDGCGDINRDGWADLLIGSPFDDGRAEVFSGSDGASLLLLSTFGGWFGYSVGGVGDLDGDAIPDVIIGAPKASIGGQLKGRARVFSGSDGTELHSFPGVSADGMFGQSVGGFGDTDGDGLGDLVIGAPLAGPGGTATVFSGIDGSMVYSFQGAVAGAELGISVAAAGDVNQDGMIDVVLGARADSSSGQPSGSARVASANRHPYFIPPTPTNDRRLTVSVGDLLRVDLAARAASGSPRIVTLTASGDSTPLNQGAFEPPLPVTSPADQPAETSFLWTPDSFDVGDYQLTVTATDVLGQSTDCDLLIRVRHGVILHVNAGSAPGGDGLTWSTACSDLQDALAFASTDPDVTEIWVAGGIYRPDRGSLNRTDSFQLLPRVGLYGGFAGNEIDRQERNPEAHPTLLSGDLLGDDAPGFINTSDNIEHVVLGDGVGPDAVLDGFVITAGNAPVSGGGLLVTSGSPTLRGCEFRGNQAQYGGAMFAGSLGTIAVEQCRFQENSATRQGGALYHASARLQLRRCTFESNTAVERGGAIYSNPSMLVGGSEYSECVFSGNSSSDGAGIAVDDGAELVVSRCRFIGNLAAEEGGALKITRVVQATLRDCLLVDNQARNGAGIFLGTTGNLTVERCTLVGNSAQVRGGGIRNQGGLRLRLQNSIVYFNLAAEGAQVHGTNDLIRYCCIQDWTIDSGTGPGNISADPQFVDRLLGNLHLSIDSPCIDSADPALSPPGVDFEGNPRFLDGDLDRVMLLDIGAFEFNNVHLSITGEATPGGLLTIESSGTPHLVALLFVGAGWGETLLPPYGALFVDPNLMLPVLPFAVIPNSTIVSVPLNLAPGSRWVVQELAGNLFTRNGNFSNAVELTIE